MAEKGRIEGSIHMTASEIPFQLETPEDPIGHQQTVDATLDTLRQLATAPDCAVKGADLTETDPSGAQKHHSIP